MNTAETKAIAGTILQQLGGRRFYTMTGASSFSSGQFKNGPGISFRIPRAKQGIMGVRIVLTPNDLYTMEFLAQRGSFKGGDYRVEVVATHEDVYFDSLEEIFERETGLATSLNLRRAQ